MPTVAETITKIRKKYPNASSDADIVEMMDNLQKIIFRKMKMPSSISYDIIADTYAFIVGIKPRMIFDVLVDGVSYAKKQLTGGSTGNSRYYSFIDDYMTIYPTPTQDGTLTIYFYITPTTLTASDTSATPDLDEDFHDLLMYGVCKELAENDQRYDVASGFAIQYNELESELAELFEILPEPETVLSESGW
jgi:hypothetical protein